MVHRREFQSFGWLNSGLLPGWTVGAMTDLNGDGHADVIWQNDSTRQVAVWYMTGAQGNQFRSFGWIASGPVAGWRALVAN